jgi:hypothetical protein
VPSRVHLRRHGEAFRSFVRAGSLVHHRKRVRSVSSCVVFWITLGLLHVGFSGVSAPRSETRREGEYSYSLIYYVQR